MTNTARVLDVLTAALGPLCDDCVSVRAGVTPRQQVFTIASRLEAEHVIDRLTGHACAHCGRFKKTSILKRGSTAPPFQPSQPENAQASAPLARLASVSAPKHSSTGEQPWHWEGSVQATLQGYLEREGWHIASAANTAAKEAGIDLVASRDGRRLLIEVKGFPTTTYAYGPRRGEPKPTQPSNQARQWFSHALLSMMRMLDKEPSSEVALCFPDYPTYRKLLAATAGSFKVLGVGVYLVSHSGTVETYTQPCPRRTK